MAFGPLTIQSNQPNFMVVKENEIESVPNGTFFLVVQEGKDNG